MKKKEPECDHHASLHIDCDRYTWLWLAIERQREEWKDIADKEELDMLDAIQKELDSGIVEK
jgi:hypothetical protein